MTTSTLLAPFQQSTLADVVTARIRKAIIICELRPGERLIDQVLAVQMGISRSPVREALLNLEREGLVQNQTNRGYYVWNPKEADIDEIFTLRTMLETLAAERIIHKLGQEDFNQLEAIIEQQRQALEAGDSLRLVQEDRRFHEYMCRAAEHSRLMNWWQQIMGQWEVLIYRRQQENPVEVSPTVLMDHHAILESLRLRDLDRVIALHHSINRRVSEEVKATLRTSVPVSDGR